MPHKATVGAATKSKIDTTLEQRVTGLSRLVRNPAVREKINRLLRLVNAQAEEREIDLTGVGISLVLKAKISSVEDGRPFEVDFELMAKRLRTGHANDVPAELRLARRFYTPEEIRRYAIQQANKDGLWFEFGVYEGGTINLIAREIYPERIYGFDSFRGLPEGWDNKNSGLFDLQGIPPKVDRNVLLVKGNFEDTLPGFLKKHRSKLAFIHIDCDLYSSTKQIFDNLTGIALEGAIILFDEYYGFDGYEKHEYRAFHEFLAVNNLVAEPIAINAAGEQAAFILKNGKNKRNNTRSSSKQ